MSWFKPQTNLDRAYLAGLVIKALDGIVEVAGGLIFLVVHPATFEHWAVLLTQNELSTDPHDFIANTILHLGQHLANGSTWFFALYLLTHGLIKLAVVAALLRGRPWAYPFALITLGLFVVYQIYLLGYTPSLGLILLTVFDLIVIWLVWKEYQIHYPRSAAKPQSQAG